MNRLWVLVVALLLASSPVFALAGGHGGHSSSGSHSSRSSGSSHSSASTGHRSSGHVSSGPHRSGGHVSKKASPSSPHFSTGHKAIGVQRDSHGKIKRDPEQRARFMRSHPCPSTGKTHGACRGYVVDHVHALKHGGRDDPSNMQWQTKAEARAKDKWE